MKETSDRWPGQTAQEREGAICQRPTITSRRCTLTIPQWARATLEQQFEASEGVSCQAQHSRSAPQILWVPTVRRKPHSFRIVPPDWSGTRIALARRGLIHSTILSTLRMAAHRLPPLPCVFFTPGRKEPKEGRRLTSNGGNKIKRFRKRISFSTVSFQSHPLRGTSLGRFSSVFFVFSSPHSLSGRLSSLLCISPFYL